jgi:hypothetical protein
MQVKKTTKQSKRPRLTTERKRKPKRASSFSPIDICGTLARLQEKHTIAQKEQKEGKGLDFDDFAPALKLLKGIIFKADQPYRTLLPLQGGFVTTAGGVVNVTQSVNSISSTSEWSSIDALFDEVFVHSMKFRFFPINDLGGGVGLSNSAGITGGITAIASTTIVNAPLQMVNLYHGAALYSTAAAMAANATLAVHSSAKPFTYYWRNNSRFDRRGDNANVAGWQGWTLIPNVTNLGGQIQFRVMQDSILGTGSALVIPGSYLCQYDVSFRCRN